MPRMSIRQLRDFVGEEIEIAGFVERVRNQKKMQFVVVRDLGGAVQLTHEIGDNGDVLARQIAVLTKGSAVRIRGKLVANSAVKLGGVELLPTTITVESLAEAELPIAEDSKLEVQLDWRFLSLRFPENELMMRVQHTVLEAMRSFWSQESFLEIYSPKLMHSASESGAETFAVEYFGQKAYLAQSPQFYKQMAMAAGLERVFEIGPVFRAEPSFTSRHATEFISIDMEMAWIDSHEDVMHLESRLLQHILRIVNERHGAEIASTFGVETIVPSVPFPKLTMAEAQRLLASHGFTPAENTRAGDLSPPGERMLGEIVQREFGSEFVFVTDYPCALRPFYHMRRPDNGEVTRSFDLLWKGVEITTGAQREHRHAVLASQAKEAGLAESVGYYLDFFRFGCPPHGGLGLGLARLMMLLLNRPSIREVSYLFRGPNRLTP